MVPAELVARQRRTEQALVTIATRDLLAVWQTLDLDDAQAATAVLVPTVRELTGAYGELAAVSAADFYDDARDAVGAPGRFRAAPATAASATQVEGITRWAVTPLWSTDPRYGDALKQLAGETGRLIRAAAHDTVTGSTARDPHARGWKRVTSAGACKFCVALADRGGVYTEATARFAAHTNCMCAAVPSWDPKARPVRSEAYEASRDTSQMSESKAREHRARTRAWLNREYPDIRG